MKCAYIRNFTECLYGFQPLTIITKRSILHVAGALDPPLDEDRYKIGKYASENGSAATVRKFKSDFSILNESAVLDFKRKYEKKLKISKNKGENISTLVTKKRGRLLLLRKLDKIIKKYIKAASKRRAVIS